MPEKKYRLNHIVKKVDRNKTTLIRWEELGLIPKAKRDSRGWRYYTQQEVNQIIDLVKKTNYFQNQINQPNKSFLSKFNFLIKPITIKGIFLSSMFFVFKHSLRGVYAFDSFFTELNYRMNRFGNSVNNDKKIKQINFSEKLKLFFNKKYQLSSALALDLILLFLVIFSWGMYSDYDLRCQTGEKVIASINTLEEVKNVSLEKFSDQSSRLAEGVYRFSQKGLNQFDQLSSSFNIFLKNSEESLNNYSDSLFQKLNFKI